MRVIETDVAVVGAGTAGLFARRSAADAGARALLIEGGAGGTTCVRCGCIPSKLLLAAARAAREVRGAEAFGVQAREVRIDGRAVMARVQGERDRFLGSLREQWDALGPDERLDGWARFSGPGVLRVGEEVEVRARSVVLAVGARPQVAPALAAAGDLVLTHETVFDLPDLPPSIAVVGAGQVGVELAMAFARLGVETTLFDKGDALGGATDPEVSAPARELLGGEVELVLGVKVEAERDGDMARVRWSGQDGRSGERRYARVLAAAGRAPPWDRLGLEHAGVRLDEDGAPVVDGDSLRCDGALVWVVGDARSERPVLHEARAEGAWAGTAAAHPDHARVRPRTPALSITYTDPDLARVGEPLSALGHDVVIGEARYEEGRAAIENRPKGLIRLYARRDGRIAGCEMVGVDGEHLAQRCADWIACGLTVDQALALPFYHPTTDEDLRAALQDAAGRLARAASS